MSRFHLAQINIGKARHPLESAEMAGFMDNLDRINGLAERSEGFVWRLQDEAGNATSIHVFDDPGIILNMSVWTSLETFKAFVYQTVHSRFIDKRGAWFVPHDGPNLAMWWIAAGTGLSAENGKDKLEKLENNGPTEAAFSFARTFNPPEIA